MTPADRFPYPFLSSPGVHVVSVPTPDGYGREVVLATVSQHKAANVWSDRVHAGLVVEADVWHGDTIQSSAFAAYPNERMIGPVTRKVGP